MNRLTEFSFLVIAPLVEQHVGEAAFHWQQHDHDAHSPVIDFDELREDDRLLQANLDGVRVAGGAGWGLAQEELNLWGNAGEVFVCAMVALAQQDAEWQQTVMAAVRDDPKRLLRALVSAVLWRPEEQALKIVQPWIRAEAEELLQVAAWRVLARGNGFLDKQTRLQLLPHFEAALRHPSEHVRAAACRASLRLQLTDRVSALLSDPRITVVAEAAIALQRSGSNKGLAELQVVVVTMAHLLISLDDDDIDLAQRRLARWLRYLGMWLPLASREVKELVKQLPVRLSLELVLHHGDASWLPWVCEQLQNPDCARYASWVWASLVGVDLEEADELILPEPELSDEDGDESLTDDLDAALPLLDQQAVTHVTNTRLSLPEGQRVLLGQAVGQLDWHLILQHAPQSLRWIAASYLERKGTLFDTRAPALQQTHVMASWNT